MKTLPWASSIPEYGVMQKKKGKKSVVFINLARKEEKKTHPLKTKRTVREKEIFICDVRRFVFSIGLCGGTLDRWIPSSIARSILANSLILLSLTFEKLKITPFFVR